MDHDDNEPMEVDADEARRLAEDALDLLRWGADGGNNLD